MASLKTVQYAFTTLASISDNTLTSLPTLTLTLEASVKSFKSVTATVTCTDRITATGGTLASHTIELRLGSAGYTSKTNSNASVHSGENRGLLVEEDFTSHFQSNWTDASPTKTCDVRVLFDQSTGTTQGMANVSVTLEITYEYDTSTATQVKTVYLPLNLPTGTLPTVSTESDSIPALATYLPEAGKTVLNTFIVVQGNTNRSTSTADITLTLQVGSATQATTPFEGGLATCLNYRYVWDLTSVYPSYNSTQSFRLRTSTANTFNHQQAWLVVTYQYDEAATTRVMNSLLLPLGMDSPMGGPTAAESQKATRDLWISEPGTITTERIACYFFWSSSSVIGGLYFKMGSNSFQAYTDRISVIAGSNAAMMRDDTAFTLVRGRNLLSVDAYSTDTRDLGWNLCALIIVNYTSDKAAGGTSKHNHTVLKSIDPYGSAALPVYTVTPATNFVIPEPDYFINAAGVRLYTSSSGTTPIAGFTIQVERLPAEGGMQWDNAYKSLLQTGAEVGIFHSYEQIRFLFKRWPGDADPTRMDYNLSRRWRLSVPAASSSAGTSWTMLSTMVTYHSIVKNVTGILSGFTGPVTLSLLRPDTDEAVKKVVVAGNGSFSIPWYDDVMPVEVLAESSSDSGMSATGVAGTTDFSIAVGSSTTYYSKG